MIKVWQSYKISFAEYLFLSLVCWRSDSTQWLNIWSHSSLWLSLSFEVFVFIYILCIIYSSIFPSIFFPFGFDKIWLWLNIVIQFFLSFNLSLFLCISLSPCTISFLFYLSKFLLFLLFPSPSFKMQMGRKSSIESYLQTMK